MESKSFVVNGGIKMPIGFRFHPTDQELVIHYLKRKALCLPLPASNIIPELDVFNTDPWNLPGDLKENKYFFSKLIKCKKRVSASGYWKPIGKEKPILAPGSNQIVGMRKTLIFCKKKCSNGMETRWFLHQYRLVGSVATRDSTQVSIGDWLVFRVFQRNRMSRAKKHVSYKSAVNLPSCIDFTEEDSSVFGPPRPTSPSSTEITEVSFSSHGFDEEESSASVTGSYPNGCTRKQ